MLKKIAIIGGLAIAISVSTLIATKPSTKVAFAQNEWTSAQSQASQENKLFFVDFDASYCAACRNMEQSTYMDSRLATFMQQNAVALRVDVQDFDGVMWSQKYEVDALPTILIFDAQGQLVQRLVGFQSASNLLKALQDAQKLAAPIAENPAPAPTPAPAPIPSDKPLNNNSNNNNPNGAAPSLFGGPKASSSIASSPLGLFEIAVTRAQRKGYSLQVGAFGNYEAALDQAELMRELYDQKTILCVDKNTENITYKLFVGNFETRDEAAKFQSTLRKNKMDGIIRDLNSI